jgi:hypothetical protein
MQQLNLAWQNPPPVVLPAVSGPDRNPNVTQKVNAMSLCLTSGMRHKPARDNLLISRPYL